MVTIQEVLDSENLAIIGASRDPFKPGAILIKVLQDLGFKGRVAGVNPSGGEVYGTPLYRTLGEIPFDIDLAVFYIPPALVPGILEECGEKGVKGAVISAEGFAEAGEDGRRVQKEVQRILRDTGMRGFGPNTLGIINTDTGLTTSYFSNGNMLRPGNIGFAAQSGVFVGAVLRYMTSLGPLGISKGLGLGNKVDVNEIDALQYFHADPQTEIIGLYLEDVRDGRLFLETARQVSAEKPVLVLKGGRTERGARATATHTASLAVDDAVFGGALKQAGVLRMDSIEEMVDSLMGFSWTSLPQGNKIAIVTYSGAQSIMSIDAAMQAGVELASFRPDTKQKIAEVIATEGKAGNPIDIFPDMMVHGFDKLTSRVLGALFEDDGVNGVILISFAQEGPAMNQAIVDTWRRHQNKPFFVSLMGLQDDVRVNADYFLDNRIPYCLHPEAAVKAFANMWKYVRNRYK